MQIATAAIIKREDKFLIAKRKPGGVVGGKWEFPGGKKENNETLEQCLERELKEELGIEAKVGAFFDLHTHKYRTGSYKIFAYNIEDFQGQMCLNEHSELKWVSLWELKKFDFICNDKPIIKKLLCAK